MMIAIAIFAIVMPIIAIVLVWLSNDGLDRLKYPEEWKDAGSSGERILYKTLIRKFKIPEKQILRNVYIPKKNGKTTEIDLIVVSKKGLFVFECKNYGGNIYGDARRQKWVQYAGRKKSYFYSPLWQNKNHAKYLREFLGLDVPIVPIVATIIRGKWKVRNLEEGDYILGVNCHFKDIYEGMSESEAMKKRFGEIVKRLRSFEKSRRLA